MKFQIEREAILPSLQKLSGVLERRQEAPILSHVLLTVATDHCVLTATDLETQITTRITLSTAVEATGSVAVPGRKLMDICRSLAEGVLIAIEVSNSRLTLKAGRSRYHLACLESAAFPKVEADSGQTVAELRVYKHVLKELFDKTSFAMAQNDVRYYLNGMLWELVDGTINVVATDGHRMSTSVAEVETSASSKRQLILPRKAVSELVRLIGDEEGLLELKVGERSLSVETFDLSFLTKLVDGRFPDFQAVIPKAPKETVFVDRETFRLALSRVSVLFSEKYRGVCLSFKEGRLSVSATNTEKEEALEELEIDYHGPDMEIGFNVNYLLDILAAIKGNTVTLMLTDATSSVMICSPDDENTRNVVMPMRL